MAQLRPVPKKTLKTQEQQALELNAAEVPSISNSSEFPNELNIRGKIYHYRTYKVKDIKKYKNAANEQEEQNALVYDLIQEKTVFDPIEYLYALIQIRTKSLDDKFNYTLRCSNCGETFEYSADYSEIAKPVFTEYTPITVGNHTFTFAEVQDSIDPEFFKSIENDPENADVLNLLSHLYNIDNNKISLTDAAKIVDDLSLADFRTLFTEFKKQIFNLDFTHDVTCPHCSNTVKMLFDDLPDFVPEEFKDE